MTRSTSSSSVDGTTEGSRQDRTGRQPIEKSNANTSDKAAQIERLLREHGAIRKGHEKMTDWGYRWFDIKSHIRHFFGIHTLILSEEWRLIDGRLRVQKRGWKCWRCEYREP